MNILINIFFIFIFLLMSFYFKYPDLSQKNYILHKIIIFGLLFCFQFIITLINKVRKGCKIVVYDLARDSLETALGGVLGYTVFNDMLFSGKYISESKFESFSQNIVNLNVTIVVVLFITLIKVVRMLFQNGNTDCN